MSKTSTNLIAVSLISSMMVLWLGTRYLSDAHMQFSAAMQLQRSVAPETTLFELAHNIDLERRLIQDILITSQDVYDGRLDRLHELSVTRAKIFERAKDEIRNSRPKASEKAQYGYSDDAIEALILDLDDKFDRISITNTLIFSQVYIPPPSRDEIIRMPLFDAYSKLIFAVNNLRLRSQVLPELNYTGVLASHEAKNSIWDASESIKQTITLVDGYLKKAQVSALDSLNRDNLLLRILQQSELARQSVYNLDEMAKGGVITGETRNTIESLRELYEGRFNDFVKKISVSIEQEPSPSVTLEESHEIATDIQDSIKNLTSAALTSTKDRANSFQKLATTTVFINTLLILLCAVMAYASFRVSKRIQHQAHHDDLTGILNRRRFCELLNTLVRKTDTAKNQKTVLLTLDLNGFKKINDTMGHTVGDKLLIGTAKRINTFHEDENMAIARTGGDEFAIAYNTKSSDNLFEFACQLRDTFNDPFNIDGNSIRIEPSVGYSVYPDDADSIEQLQITSDFAMFSAKQSSTKKVQPYDREIAAQFEKRSATEKDLNSAIENNELELYYQPKFDISLNKVNSVEALVRWNHPTRGMVSPFEFIEIAEETGLMPAIGNWILNEGVRQAAMWNNQDGIALRVAVNVSVHQLMQTEFVDNVIDALQRNHLDASCLELEITESVVIGDVDWIVACLKRLKKAGLRIALDDFGTGYSSLSQLQALPLDTLKIDRSFISTIDDDSSNMKSVTATIASIAEIYQLETVAEGIETLEQLEAVTKLGIDIAQGYYYSKPLASNELTTAIAKINSEAMIDDTNDRPEPLRKAA